MTLKQATRIALVGQALHFGATAIAFILAAIASTQSVGNPHGTIEHNLHWHGGNALVTLWNLFLVCSGPGTFLVFLLGLFINSRRPTAHQP